MRTTEFPFRPFYFTGQSRFHAASGSVASNRTALAFPAGEDVNFRSCFSAVHAALQDPEAATELSKSVQAFERGGKKYLKIDDVLYWEEGGRVHIDSEAAWSSDREQGAREALHRLSVAAGLFESFSSNSAFGPDVARPMLSRDGDNWHLEFVVEAENESELGRATRELSEQVSHSIR